MTERIYVPTGRLSAFVECIWYSGGYRPASAWERVLPAGCAELMFNLDGVSFRDHEGRFRTRPRELGMAVVAGARASTMTIDSTRRLTTMGAVLRPGAIRALLNLPAAALAGETIALDDLGRDDMTGFRQRLSEAGAIERKLQLLEGWLRRRLDPAFELLPAVLPAIEACQKSCGRLSVADMVASSGYSRRRFLDRFKDAVGLTPKTYARLLRFQRVLAHAQGAAVHDWARFAVDCGYYDQAHLIQDFRQFAGVTPMAYKQAHPLERNHLAL